MGEDKGKKKYRYTYYTATGKEEIEVDGKWYEILRLRYIRGFDRTSFQRQEWKGTLSSPKTQNEKEER